MPRARGDLLARLTLPRRRRVGYLHICRRNPERDPIFRSGHRRSIFVSNLPWASVGIIGGTCPILQKALEPWLTLGEILCPVADWTRRC